MSSCALPVTSKPWLRPPAAQALPPPAGAVPPRALAATERRAMHQLDRNLLALALSGALLLVWLEGLAWITMGFAQMFKGMLGDEPLPAITQIVIGLANQWSGGLRWFVLAPLALGAVLAVHHWRRRERTAASWRQLCRWLGQEPSAQAPADQADWWRYLREPWVSTWARHQLGPPAPAFAGPPVLPTWARMPEPMALLLARRPAWPSAAEWATTSRLLNEDEAASPTRLAWLPQFQYSCLLAVLFLSGLAVWAFIAPLVKQVEPGCLGG